ncbi:MAG: sugar-binding transcriptional regulator [Anaerolineae bacterium]|nr:sugar-binding transcriptional regulator [Anaerolineae bacterium]
MLTDRAELLAAVASMYYEDNLTQDEIARRINQSRSTVSRLLQEARASGVVEITVHYPWKTVPELEQELTSRFPLRQARVLAGRGKSYEDIGRGLGVLAARYIETLIRDNVVLGISWGVAVYHTVRAMRAERPLALTAVQMVGAVGEGDPLIDGPDLVRLLASIYGGEYRYLHAPLIVADRQTRERLLQEPRIRDTLALARRAEVALVGIGAPVAGVYSLLRAGYLNQADLEWLRAQGVVGDICARHYDALGNELDIELNHRVVGIELAALHAIPYVIGVAGGAAKAEAILGALRGGHVNVLVTDDTTVVKMLELAGYR